MKHKIQEKLRLQSEKILHGLVLGTVIFSVALMSVGTIQIIQAGLTGDTNVAQNVTAGSLALDNVPAQINFNSGTPGANTTANTATSGVVTNDTSGAKAGWDLTGYFNTNFRNADNSVEMNIADVLGWFPGAATITPVTGDAGGAVAGANNNFAGNGSGNSLRLMNSNNSADNKGAGAYNMTALIFNFNIPITATATDYTTNLRLTIA